MTDGMRKTLEAIKAGTFVWKRGQTGIVAKLEAAGLITVANSPTGPIVRAVDAYPSRDAEPFAHLCPLCHGLAHEGGTATCHRAVRS